MWENFKPNVEILTENIANDLENLEQKSNSLLAIKQTQLSQYAINKWLRIQLEGKVDTIPNIVLTPAYDSKNDTYYITSTWNKYINVPLKIDWFTQLLETLEELYLVEPWLFWDKLNTLSLSWKVDFRKISTKNIFPSNAKTIYYKWHDSYWMDNEQSKDLNNPTEEIYKFVMQTKWVPVEDWDVVWVLNWEITNENKLTIWTWKNSDIELAIKDYQENEMNWFAIQ